MPTKRLDYLTRALVLKLRAAEPDRSVADLATIAGVSESSARRILQAHTTDAKSLTRELLVSGVLDRLDDWARASRVASSKGYHHGAKEWLEAAQVTDAKPASSVQIGGPSVVVNIPFPFGAIAGAAVPPNSSDVLPGSSSRADFARLVSPDKPDPPAD